MLATHEAQVIPMMQMKHLWAFVSCAEAACDPGLLLTASPFDDMGRGRSDGPGPTGHDLF